MQSKRTYWIALISSSILEITGLSIMKMTLNHHALSELKLGFNLTSFWACIQTPFFALGGAAYLTSPFVFAFALSKLPLSVGLPIKVNLSVVLVLLSGVILFDEPISLSKILGCLLIVASILLMRNQNT